MKKYIRISIYIIIYLYLIYPSIILLFNMLGYYELIPNLDIFNYIFIPPIIPGAIIDTLFSLIIWPSGHSNATGYIAVIFNIILWTYTCLLVYFKGGKFLSELKGNQNIKKDNSLEI